MAPPLFILRAPGGGNWLLTVTNAGAYGTGAGSSAGAASISLLDTVTGQPYALTVLDNGALEVTAVTASGLASIPLQAPNGVVWDLVVTNGALATIKSSLSTAVIGLGSKLEFSLDNATFTVVAQLRKISPQGSKQTIIDQTNVLTAGNCDAPLAVRYSSGEIDIDGVLLPQDPSQITLGELNADLTLAYWKLLLSDGVTVWTFQAFVSKYKPFDIAVSKAVTFGATLRIWGAITGPPGDI